MRQTVAKRLRHTAYGDMADARQYVKKKNGQIVLAPACIRGFYQQLKGAYVRGEYR